MTPIEIEAKGELSLAATAELGSTAKPAQYEPRLALPFFRAAKATATPGVARHAGFPGPARGQEGQG
jgi:hypothetical protein